MKKYCLILMSVLFIFSVVPVKAEDNLAGADLFSTTLKYDHTFITPTLAEMMEEFGQDNVMLQLAWEDYQQISEYDFFDLTTMEESGVTTYLDVLRDFTPSYDPIEPFNNIYEDGYSLISFVYKAPEGDLHPERELEDWAMIDMYFFDDKLVYSGITSLSLSFHTYNSFPQEDVISLLREEAAVTDLTDYQEFEIYALGQVKSDDEFYYGLGFPMTEIESNHETYGGAASLVIYDDYIYSGIPTNFDEAIEQGFTTIMLNSLIEIVPNYYFNIQEEL
ncbi:hypothetical protein HZY88_08700 [Aerococcaceae bacterium DSM 111176]|nr:hypothetical protein [Aerococcaceae bacterium DSM 111176]